MGFMFVYCCTDSKGLGKVSRCKSDCGFVLRMYHTDANNIMYQRFWLPTACDYAQRSLVLRDLPYNRNRAIYAREFRASLVRPVAHRRMSL